MFYFAHGEVEGTLFCGGREGDCESALGGVLVDCVGKGICHDAGDGREVYGVDGGIALIGWDVDEGGAAGVEKEEACEDGDDEDGRGEGSDWHGISLGA